MDGVKGFLREEFLRVRGPLLLSLAVVKDNVKIQKSVELLKIFSCSLKNILFSDKHHLLFKPTTISNKKTVFPYEEFFE